ncbi:MAG: ABC transporter substrate-binding protein [Candidatus Hatepunaea meridiana]|nr:ABC transporter substrate-binding protein [Candidatus Hatepunaea meridiana]
MSRRFILLTILITVLGLSLISCEKAEVTVLKVGHVGHDHHTALYVAALNGDLFKKDYGLYLEEVRPKQLYRLIDGKKVICELELYKAGGGSKMPTDMAQGIFDVGFGGVAAVAFFVDKGTPMKIISPLHSKGDMLVVGKNVPAKNWDEFVEFLKNRKEPLRVGFKTPKAIALLIFEGALREVGIPYTRDAKNRKAKVLLTNLKSAKHLNPALQNEIIDAYVCNNPFCAIAEDKGIGTCIADLNDLPPGLWKDHPCCMIAAMENVIVEKREELVKFLELIVIATDYINANQRIAIKSASKWIGTSIAVEEKSIPTSGYLTKPNKVWLSGIYTWAHSMEELGHLKGQLKGKNDNEINKSLLDLSLIKEARRNVKARKK